MPELIFTIALLLISLFVLLKGADYLVDGAVDIARWMGVSPILVGLTIVAFGTSLPEFVVSFFSLMSGNADLSLGNIIGSNIVNASLIIGLASMWMVLQVKSKTLMYELPFMVVSSFLLLVLSVDRFIWGTDTFTIGRIDGLIFLTIFGFFLYYIFLSVRDGRQKAVTKEFRSTYRHIFPPWKDVLMILGGILAVGIGGRFFTVYAKELSDIAGLGQAFVGLTIAAIGTSMPELATSIVAAWKKKGDIAIGNIVGSNIFNILFVVGFNSLFFPIQVNPEMLTVDAVVMIFITLLFLLFATNERKILRWEGAILIISYLAYLGFLLWNL